MVQILNILLAAAILTSAIAAPVHETRIPFGGGLRAVEKHYIPTVTNAVYKRGGAPRKPTLVGKVINGVEKYAKQCHSIRDEESGNIFVRELSADDIEYLDARDPAGGTWRKVVDKVKGLAHRCQFIRDDETNEVYVRADFDDAEMLDARNSQQAKSLLRKAIKGAKGLAQRCHFMRDVDEELLSRDPAIAFGEALKKVKGLAHRCHFIRDDADDYIN